MKEYDLFVYFNAGPLTVGEVMRRASNKNKSKVEEGIYVIGRNLGSKEVGVVYSKCTWK